jgi:CHAD domain-containing protein
MGPARDMDVWLALLHSDGLQKTCGRQPRWKSFLAAQVRAREALQAGVRRNLSASAVRVLRADMGMLLRVELPRANDTGKKRPTLRAFADRKLERAGKAVKKASRLARSSRASDLHRFRKSLRRVRHLAEFFGPVLGADGLAERIRVAERELGRAHDLDIALERVRASRLRPPDGLARWLRKRRHKHMARFRRAWKRLEPNSLFKA